MLGRACARSESPVLQISYSIDGVKWDKIKGWNFHLCRQVESASVHLDIRRLVEFLRAT